MFPNLQNLLQHSVRYNGLYGMCLHMTFLFQASQNPSCFVQCNLLPNCYGFLTHAQEGFDQRKCVLVMNRTSTWTVEWLPHWAWVTTNLKMNVTRRPAHGTVLKLCTTWEQFLYFRSLPLLYMISITIIIICCADRLWWLWWWWWLCLDILLAKMNYW